MKLQDFRQYLPTLTLVALIAGLFCSFAIKDSTYAQDLSNAEFFREADRGSGMELIIRSAELEKYASDPGALEAIASKAEPVRLGNLGTPGSSTTILIPDRYSARTVLCGAGYEGVSFRGKVSGGSTIYGPQNGGTGIQYDAPQERHLSAAGSLWNCAGSRPQQLLATGVTLTAYVQSPESPELVCKKVTAWATFPAIVAKGFVTLLLMLFIPVLAFSLLKALVDSADSSWNFRFVGKYIAGTSLLAATVGGVSGLVVHHFSGKRNPGYLASLSLGEQQPSAAYDPHPLLSQLASLVPANPLGALTAPDGNSGLQVAFIAILVGGVLMFLDPGPRKRVSDGLKNILAILIKDRDLNWRAMSEFVEFVIPFGVFSVTLTVFSESDPTVVGELGRLFVAIVIGLMLHCGLLAYWLVRKRDWRSWLARGFRPGLPGIVTSFATASSYAALPAIADVPLVRENSAKRGVLDIGTTLNKNGTALYIAAAASYLFFNQTDVVSLASVTLNIALIAGVSVLAAIATAGVPFAAVIALRMVLLFSGVPGGLAWFVLPIDPLIDRFVTSVNVLSNLSACSDPVAQRVPQRNMRQQLAVAGD